MTEEAQETRDLFYITDLCKCHWRTSRGTPIKSTEYRSSLLPEFFAHTCLREWLTKESEILKPKCLMTFGEEVYQIFKRYIISPTPVPLKLSVYRDKSAIDAEQYVSDHGSLTIKFAGGTISYLPLRHPGNSTNLVRSNDTDKRWEAHSKSREKAIEILRARCA